MGPGPFGRLLAVRLLSACKYSHSLMLHVALLGKSRDFLNTMLLDRFSDN